MSEGATTHAPAHAAELARGTEHLESLAREGRVDAVSSGIVKGPGALFDSARRGASPAHRSVRRVLSYGAGGLGGKGDEADAGGAVGKNASAQTRVLLQGECNMRSKIADAAAEELDESDEMEGISDIRGAARGARRSVRHISAKAQAKSVSASGASEAGQAAGKGTSKVARAKRARAAEDRRAEATGRNIQSRRTWMRARAAQEKAGKATLTAVTKKEGVKAATTATSTAAPFAGVIGGVVAFVLAALVVSQAASALFGFWENEHDTQAVPGLPPYITREMVVTALEMQERYGHPAGCTLAQIICESGQGDRLSGLATRDKNLFGIKWSVSFALAEEVEGKDSWETHEEYGGQDVTVMADFTKFKSHRDCIVFRSRVLLQEERYAGNAFIQEAMATRSSDRMAEGLKDAGYATSTSYVDSLKSVMAAYNLCRFDSMSVEQFESIGQSGSAVVEAAYSQLGIPYVWGGTTPNVGLDCSGLTQYCYACAGKPIPRNSEDQMAGGTVVPLSEARLGDILWRPGHVAIYIGGDSYIHEPQAGDVCRIADGISYFTCAIRY